MIYNILEYLEKSSTCYPQKTAFQDEKRCITYEELEKKAKMIGYALANKLKKRNKPIVVMMDKSVECLIAFFGVVYSGNFYVCIAPDMAEKRVKHILENLKPECVISTQAYKEKTIFGVECCEYSELITKVENDEMEKKLAKIREESIDTDPLYVLYTSGSTGIPKGSVISHKSVIAYTEWVSETFHIDDTAIFGSQTPFYFSMSVLDIFTTIKNGATLQIIPKKYFSFPVKLLQYLEEKEVNIIYWVPSALTIVANWKALDYVKLTKLKTILFAGEVMPTRQLNIWRKYLPNALYANLFGPTEITDIALYHILDREYKDEEPIPIGKACRNMNVFALNESNEKIKNDEIGELYFRGSFVGFGYYNNEQKTKEAFVQNPLNSNYPEMVYRTGDLVRMNERGEYIYVGRKDFQIKHMGYRIELGEIEAAVSTCEKIDTNACLYDKDTERIVLIFQGKLEISELHDYLANYLPTYMLPNDMVKVRSMPHNANGKIDRKLLEKKYIQEMNGENKDDIS